MPVEMPVSTEISWTRQDPREHQTQGSYLADMVPEDGLVGRVPQLPLEPRLRLSTVGDLRCRGSVLDLREVRHGIPHGDGPVGARG